MERPNVFGLLDRIRVLLRPDHWQAHQEANAMNLILMIVGSCLFGVLLAVAGVTYKMPSFYPLILQYAVVQSLAMRAFS